MNEMKELKTKQVLLKFLISLMMLFIINTESQASYSKWKYEELETFKRITSKNPKEIRKETILLIVEICDSLEIPPQIFLAMGDVESGGKFNPLLYADLGHINTNYLRKPGHWSSGSIFQIGNAYTRRWRGDTANECMNENRHCLFLSIPAIWNKLQYSKNIIEKKMGKWEDYYYYSRIHNPGHASAGLSNPVVKKFDNKMKYWEGELEKLRNIIAYRKLKEQFADVNPEMIEEKIDTVKKDVVDMSPEIIKQWLNSDIDELNLKENESIAYMKSNDEFIRREIRVIFKRNECYVEDK